MKGLVPADIPLPEDNDQLCFDQTIMVDANVHTKAFYPVDMNYQVLDPELEDRRLGKVFAPADLSPYYLRGQKQKSGVCGLAIYERLRGEGLLPRCLSVAALNAINEKGFEFFSTFWKKQTLVAWASVIQLEKTGRIIAPTLTESARKGVLALGWEGIKLCHYGEESPIYLFPDMSL